MNQLETTSILLELIRIAFALTALVVIVEAINGGTDPPQVKMRYCEQVLDAVAKEEGCSPLEFDQTLYDVIDPDALNTVLRDSSPDVAVTFSYQGYQVTVHGDGQIELDT